MLGLHIWNKLFETLETKWTFQTFKKTKSYWFGLKLGKLLETVRRESDPVG